MSWKKYFNVKGVRPGVVVLTVPVAGLKSVDLRNETYPVETMIKLYEADFPHLELTPEGFNKFYPDQDPGDIVDKFRKSDAPENKLTVGDVKTDVEEIEDQEIQYEDKGEREDLLDITDLKDKTVDDLVVLIRGAKTKEEADLYKSLKPESVKVKSAYKKRIEKGFK